MKHSGQDGIIKTSKMLFRHFRHYLDIRHFKMVQILN